MPVLGKAIAAHLRELRGLYSVELPASLRQEIVDLVSACNKDSPKRALFVADGGLSASLAETITWAELLGWRTGEDRIFVWERSSREPDTSFKSVVKPFISGRFPGNPTGECTIDLLAELSIVEIWKLHGLNPVGSVFDAFLETAKWVSGILRYSFEGVGSTPSAHWSDAFLVHWAETLNLVAQALSRMPSVAATLLPRHAWELLRTAGLPVPSSIVGGGNPFLESPRPLNEREWPRLAAKWQGIVETSIVPEESRAVLLTALDWITKGAERTSPWRGLPWDLLRDLRSDDMVAAPTVGQRVFASEPSPSLFVAQPPAYPGAPRPSWWGVTEADIAEALDQLAQTTLFRPSASCEAIVPIPDLVDTYWLKTRSGTVSPANSQKSWKAEVVLGDLEIVFKAPWSKVTVSFSQPTETSDGHAWINPDDVSLKVTGSGVGVDVKELSVESGTQLLARVDLKIAYSGKRDEKEGTVSGKWNPIRTMQIEAKVRDCRGGSWKSTRRQVDSSITVVIPSPFSPTILVVQPGRKKPVHAPGTRDGFIAGFASGELWEAEEATPDLILKEEGTYTVDAYDGCLEPTLTAFMPEVVLYLNDTPLPSPEASQDPYTCSCSLDEGDVIRADSPARARDVAVIKVKERSANLSSGLLSAVRGLPAGQKPPSTEARSTLPGQYQDRVTSALCKLSAVGYNSLFQYVLADGDTLAAWPEHSGKPEPEYLFVLPEGFSLPGIGNGPSPDLVDCPEWLELMDALGKVCKAIELQPGHENTWLSGFDPGKVPGSVIKTYLKAHCNLVRAAKEISRAATFWACYPFSIMIVEGSRGASRGQLLAVLLSPLHPARLAWAFSVAFTAKHSKSTTRGSAGLIGLAEGWNIPCTGQTVSIAGQALPMVAIPIDPGREQDFATWSALVVLDRDGLASLPHAAAGLPLPWAGQTGINEKVITRALKDYLAVHPHVNSLEVDIRSVSDAPRSREIDSAVLKLVGGVGALEEVDMLGGGTRVQDSVHRIGQPPTRDDLFLVRQEGEHRRPFEWRRYQSHDTPASADIAFIENSSVHLALGQGSVNGLVGYLPLKRFSPTTLKIRKLMLEQHYSTHPGDDLLGLANLLAEIEHGDGAGFAALQAFPQAHALGVGMGARWEILGTFNVDPTLLSSVVAQQAQSAGKRLLWEWRPSWLSHDRKDTDIAKRPYYVVGRIPASLLRALHYRQGFTDAQAFDMLLELGRRGIGLTSLHAAGGTQESAAAGFFYALRLLHPAEGHQLPAKWILLDNDAEVCGLIPMDPIEPILEELAGEKLGHRADLLAVRITQDEITRICLVPIEVKHHGQENDPEPLPNNTNSELGRARDQLAETADLIAKIAQAIHPGQDGSQDLPACYARLTGLATLIELAMSLTPVHPAPGRQAGILRDVLHGNVSLGVGHPVLLWFAPGSITTSGEACIVDPHGKTAHASHTLREVFIDPSAVRGLWWSRQAIGPDERQTRQAFDEVILDALSACSAGDLPATTDLRAKLSELLELDTPAVDEDEKVVTLPGKGRDEPDIQESFFPLDDAAKQSKLPGPTAEEKPVPSTADAASIEHPVDSDMPSMQPSPQVPDILVGSTGRTSRWAIIGRMAKSNESVALDLDHPKAMGIFGYMGSGKSYLLGTIIEAAAEPIPALNELPVPLALVVFNYRRNAADRFELSSLALPNQKATDVARLATEYGAMPQPVDDIHILCLSGELGDARLEEYGGLPASELYFDPATLTVEDWELLMGEPGSSAVFARAIRHALVELHLSREVTLENLEHQVSEMLKGQSLAAAQLRFDFVRRHLSKEQGIDFDRLVQPGRVLVLDLRQPLFAKGDALRFFLICSNYVSRVQGEFNKLVVFDEAHEYLSDEFSERLDARIRLMRHEGTSYVFATQDVGSIPRDVSRFINTWFVFNLSTRENMEDLLKLAPEFRNCDLRRMKPGDCLVLAHESTRGICAHPRMIHVRPRVTQHGGASRIFSTVTRTT